MNQNSIDIPNGEQLEKLPLWAIVYFARRSARAGGLLFAEIAINAPKKHIREIERALQFADDASSNAGKIDDAGECAVIANNLFYVACNIENVKREYHLGATQYGVDDYRAALCVLAAAYGALSAAYGNWLYHDNIAHQKNIEYAHQNAQTSGYSTFRDLPRRKACAYSAARSASFAAEAWKGECSEHLLEIYERASSLAASRQWNDNTPVSDRDFAG